MRIKKILYWNDSREFTALYVCEHCGSELQAIGYDDQDLHDCVVPAMKCAACCMTGGREDFVPLIPRGPDDPTD